MTNALGGSGNRFGRLDYFCRSIVVFVVSTTATILVGASPLALVIANVAFGLQVWFSVRRLRDIGESGWFAGILFIPLFNLLFLAFLFVAASKPDDGESQDEPLPNQSERPDLASLCIMAGYGFVAGLPLPLSTFTLRYWLSESGATLSVIGLTANIGLAYSLKFLWSPLFDQVKPPGPLRHLGQRRGWLVTIQPALALSAALLALSDPVTSPVMSIAVAALVALLSASQDIAIDAWRIETFAQRQQGAALTTYVWGYRIAMLAATTGVIWASGFIGWHLALFGVAILLLLGPAVTLFASKPAVPDEAARSSGDTLMQRARRAVIDPLQNFLIRPGAVLILMFVALFKLGEAMGGIMTAPFYRELGFSRDAIAGSGPFSMFATLTGIAVGGWMVARIGVGRALLWTGSAQTVAMLMYEVLAHMPGDRAILYLTVSTEAFAQGMADAAFLTYLSGLCARAFTATHYALLSSIPALAIHTIGGFSGVVAGAVGWVEFYAICTFAALPAMGLMVVLLRRYPPDK